MSGDIKDWLTSLDEMDQSGIKRLDSYRKSLLTKTWRLKSLARVHMTTIMISKNWKMIRC